MTYYRRGSKFQHKHFDNHHIVVISNIKQAFLVNIHNGNLWNAGIKVQSSDQLTLSELKALMGFSYDDFKGVDGTVYPPKQERVYNFDNGIKATIEKEHTTFRDTTSYDGQAVFILKNVTVKNLKEVWYERNLNVAVTPKLVPRIAGVEHVLTNVMLPPKDKWEWVTWGITDNISDGFFWGEQSHYWNLIHKLAKVEWERKPLEVALGIGHPAVIENDKVIVGCKTFNGDDLNKFFRVFTEATNV